MKILLIDDERNFLDGREHVVLRSSYDAIDHFSNEDGTLKDVAYDEVWLDYILKGSDDITNFVYFAKKKAAAGTPLNVKEFVIHTSSWAGAGLIGELLTESGYKHRRFDISYQVPVKVISN